MALTTFIDNIELSDKKIFSINLKRTISNNMSRFSKKKTSTSSPHNKIIHYKVYIVSNIDKKR